MMKTEHQQRVEQFMDKAGQEIPVLPLDEPTEEVRILRARLVWSELVKEMIGEGLGVGIYLCDGANEYLLTNHNDGELEFRANGKFDLVAAVDGCIDGSVVTIGTLSALGVPDQPFLEMVDANNLEKFGPGGYRNDQGKWIKPPGHTPPDIAGLLQRIKDGYVPTRTTAQDRVDSAVKAIEDYAVNQDSSSVLCIDKVLRLLTGEKYDEVITAIKAKLPEGGDYDPIGTASNEELAS